MNNLFVLHLSKKEQLLIWMKEKEFARTSEIIKWGSDNFCNTADRIARKLRQDGILRRLSDEEKRFRGFGKSKEDVYQIV